MGIKTPLPLESDISPEISKGRSVISVILVVVNVLYATLLVFVALIPNVPGVGSVVPDSWVHAVAYGFQTILIFFVLRLALLPRLASFFAFICVSVFGAGVEMLQHLQPFRSVEGSDLLANTVGALVAAFLILVIRPAGIRRSS